MPPGLVIRTSIETTKPTIAKAEWSPRSYFARTSPSHGKLQRHAKRQFDQPGLECVRHDATRDTIATIKPARLADVATLCLNQVADPPTTDLGCGILRGIWMEQIKTDWPLGIIALGRHPSLGALLNSEQFAEVCDDWTVHHARCGRPYADTAYDRCAGDKRRSLRARPASIDPRRSLTGKARKPSHGLI